MKKRARGVSNRIIFGAERLSELVVPACLALATGACSANVGGNSHSRTGVAGVTGGTKDTTSNGAGGTGNAGTGSVVGSGSGNGTGGVSASGPGPLAALGCPTPAPEAATPRRLWRLNPREYAGSVGTLLSGRRQAAQPMPGLPVGIVNPLQPPSARYSTDSGAVTVSDAEFGFVLSVAGEIATQLVQSVKVGTCWATESAAFDACASTLVQEKGSILFRRPLAAEEVVYYVALAKRGVAELGSDGALAVAFQSLLLAPQFLFKPEIGAATPTASVYRLTPHEVGSFLAYSLTAGPPDTELWDAAQRGELTTPEQIKTQTARIMGTEAAYGARNFVTEYFKLGAIQGVAKTADMILAGESTACHYNKNRLVLQAEASVGDVYASNANSGFINALFTTPNVFVDCSSELLLGLTGAPPDTGGPVKMAAPAGQRAGFLTSPTWLGALATRDDTKPVRRGLFVNKDVLCTDVPTTVPDGVPPLGDTTTLTMRERLAVHAQANSSCKVCHDLLDAPGLAFENYDTVGAYRTTHNGKPVDAGGTLLDLGGVPLDVDGAKLTFTNAVDFSNKIAGTSRVQECVLRNGFRYFLGRTETTTDACSLTHAVEAYKPAGSYVEFVGALASSDSFLNRRF